MITVKDFVSDALFQIAEGIWEANSRLSQAGIDAEAACNLVSRGDNVRVDFDILLSVSKSSEASIKGDAELKAQGDMKLYVVKGNVEGTLDIDSERKKSKEDAMTHRMQFSVLTQFNAKYYRDRHGLVSATMPKVGTL